MLRTWALTDHVALLYTMDTETTPNKKQPLWFMQSPLLIGKRVVLGLCLVGIGVVFGLWLHMRLGGVPNPLREPPKAFSSAMNPPTKEAHMLCGLQIEVLDAAHHPMKGAEVLLAEAKPILGSEGSLLPVGELGVWKGALPTPMEVVTQSTVPASSHAGTASIFRPVYTDANGFVRWLDIPSGLYHVTGTLGAQKGQLWVRWRGEKDGSCGALAQQVVLVLQADSSAVYGSSVGAVSAGVMQSVTVAVMDRQNHPLASAVVQGQVGGQSFLCATNSQGRCVLSNLPQQELTLTVRAGSRTAWSRVIPLSEWASTDLLHVTVGGENGLEGRVRDGRLGIVRSRMNLLLRTAEGEMMVPVDASGHFVIEGIPAGSAVLRLQASGYVTFEEKVEVPTSGWVRGMLLELKRAGMLEGRVRSLGAGALAGVKVRALNQEGALLGQSSIDARGEYRMEGLPPGDVWVVCGDAKVQVQIYPDHVQRAPELEIK